MHWMLAALKVLENVFLGQRPGFGDGKTLLGVARTQGLLAIQSRCSVFAVILANSKEFIKDHRFG
jgi:hypothetical protein